jgi:tRNA(Ile)-lysidine synthase
MVVRPLLSLTREQVLDYLEDRGIPSVQDATNADPVFLRNRLRNTVLPLLREQANPRVDRALLRLAAQARRASAHLVGEARVLLEDAARDEGGWDARALDEADAAVRAQALAELVGRFCGGRGGARHVDSLESLLAGRIRAAQLPRGRRLRIEDGRLTLEREEDPSAPAPDLPLSVPGEVLDEDAHLRFEARVIDGLEGAPSADPGRVALLDAERITGPLRVRRRRSGDRFWPLGAPGHRSLKRFFIDQKVPRRARDTIPVVTLGDQPVWIVGHRIDEQFKVTPSTARVLELRAIAVPGKKGK